MTEPLPKPPRVRFAPAPTGYLHLGGARTALFNWLYARHHAGRFILRVEDTDLERSTEDSSRQVLDGLRWLGLDWDEGPDVGGDRGPYYQSERRELHLEHARLLIEGGRAYECYMTTEELDVHRQVAHAAGKPFHYEGWHRELTREQVAAFRAEGRRPAIRLKVDPPAEGWTVHDLIKGDTHFPPEQIDDFVLVRSDGTPSFHLANVVDDATMGITHVIRGEDHLTNTVRHQILFDAFVWARPQYAHLPMILGPDRSKLSKRHGAVSVLEYEKLGYLPDAMVNELALLGWSPADGKEELTREELIERFDLDRCGRSASIFDFAKLDHFNRVRLHAMSPEQLAEALEPFSVHLGETMREKGKLLIELLRDDLTRLNDFVPAAKRFLDEPETEPAAVLALLAAENLHDPRPVLEKLRETFAAIPEPWERAAIKASLNAAGKEIGAKGKALFMPLRAALTGALHGPALDGILAALGKDKVVERIGRFLTFLPQEP